MVAALCVEHFQGRQDRRKQLLDEMIDVELLAREAERRGLAERPETKELVRQILRDEVFAELREKQPPLEEIPELVP